MYHSSLPANDLLVSRATAVEVAVWDDQGGTNGQYKSKIRSLFVNLKDPNNPGLRESVVSGEVTAEKLSTMSSEVLPHSIPVVECVNLLHRNWLPKSVKLQTGKSRRRTYLPLMPLLSRKLRRMLSNVEDANRFVIIAHSQHITEDFAEEMPLSSSSNSQC